MLNEREHQDDDIIWYDGYRTGVRINAQGKASIVRRSIIIIIIIIIIRSSSTPSKVIQAALE
jgi:hypothetical protein